MPVVSARDFFPSIAFVSVMTYWTYGEYIYAYYEGKRNRFMRWFDPEGAANKTKIDRCALVFFAWQTLSLDEGIFFQIGARFPSYTIQDISLVYAEPPEGCQKLTNEFISGDVVLLERGGCPFVEKVLNAQEAGAAIALITDSSSGGDDFIDMVTDDSQRRGDIPAAWLPGVSGRRLREYLVYEKPELWIQIPLNYTNRSLRDTFANKPPWELW
uniref:PA domain-containing protein n=1 Tax=Globodera rostochiensis TaxID=31243 RepID=A0A914IBP1_GLORO